MCTMRKITTPIAFRIWVIIHIIISASNFITRAEAIAEVFVVILHSTIKNANLYIIVAFFYIPCLFHINITIRYLVQIPLLRKLCVVSALHPVILDIKGLDLCYTF